ncbi:Midasin [Bienertia sinuspersici]
MFLLWMLAWKTKLTKVTSFMKVVGCQLVGLEYLNLFNKFKWMLTGTLSNLSSWIKRMMLQWQKWAAPYWERPAGPVWWCHVDASHQNIISWLSNAQWLHPAVSIALRDESRLMSERMRYLLYEVPVRVAGGLLFELLGQSAGDPLDDEDDIPVVLRSWQAQNFMVTAMHMKGSALNVNVLGVMEVQELLIAGGYNAPRTIHEVIAHLACRLARWDDR